jgi:hypothetical protein
LRGSAVAAFFLFGQEVMSPQVGEVDLAGAENMGFSARRSNVADGYEYRMTGKINRQEIN